MTATPLRPEIAALEIPERVRKLPVDKRGYPVPWFVEWIDGAPEFRIMDATKYVRAIREKLCWVCGQRLGSYLAFVVGPMCAVNRVSSEPPSHRECAEFAAIACPFLARPHMRRREAGLPEGADTIGGLSIDRNPGVALVWITKSYRVEKVHNGYLVRMGEPREVLCFAEGRRATPAEVRASVVSGLPLLEAEAAKEGMPAKLALRDQTRVACRVLGIADPIAVEV